MPLREFGPIPWDDWHPDPDVEEWCYFLIGIVGDDEWANRRQGIEEHLRGLQLAPDVADLHTQEWVPPDSAAWHLFMCESFVRNPTQYPLAQGARHLPLVKSLMRDWPRVREIEGVEERLRHGFMNERSHFDAALFELLVGLAYLRAGRGSVAFIPTQRGRRTPDIRVSGEGDDLLVECKRKSRLSDYARNERRRWLELFQPLREWLVANGRGWVLDFVFHLPLVGLPDDWLADKTIARLTLAAPGIVIDDPELTLTVREVNLDEVQAELRDHGIRSDGSRLPTLLFGEFDPSVGVSSAIHYRAREGMPHVVDEVSWACGGTWTCDASQAVEAKARHMKRDLAEAVTQIPAGQLGAVHWGVDIYSGELVKREVYQQTLQTVAEFDLGGRAVEWVYAHIFEFFVPPDETFDLIEDVHFFGRSGNVTERLEPALLIVPGEDRASQTRV